VQFPERDRACSRGAEYLHLCVEGHQRHREIRGVRRDALFGGAQDRRLPGRAADRGTAGTGLALVARRADVLEVDTPGALQRIPANGGHVAQLIGRARQQGLRQHRVALPDPRVGGQFTVAQPSSDPQAPAGQLADLAGQHPGDIHQQARSRHPQAQMVDEIRSAAEERRPRCSRHLADGGLDIVGRVQREGLHRVPRAAC
jgi:hypothetical protein